MPSDHSESIRRTFLENAAEITRLHKRIHETYENRDRGTEQYEAWKNACAEFHEHYDDLAFPGGYTKRTTEAGGHAKHRIESGDPDAMEMAVCFLECRPYFFGSGYMFQKILRMCRRAPLSEEQAARFMAVKVRYTEWKKKKRAAVR